MSDWFRVYCRKGVTYEGPPELAPKTQVQIILQESKRHVLELIDSAHYYVWGGFGRSKRWFPATPDQFYFYLAQDDQPKVVLFGLYIDDDEFNEIKVRAIHDQKKSPHRLERNVAEREV